MTRTGALIRIWLGLLGLYVAGAMTYLWILEGDLVRSSRSVAPEGRSEFELDDVLLSGLFDIQLAPKRRDATRFGVLFFAATGGLIALYSVYDGSQKVKETSSP